MDFSMLFQATLSIFLKHLLESGYHTFVGKAIIFTRNTHILGHTYVFQKANMDVAGLCFGV